MWLLLIPLLVLLIALSLVLGTAAVFVTIAREVPWLLILGGAWLIWRGQRRRGHRHAYTAPEPSGIIIEHEPSPRTPAAAVAIEVSPKAELPIDVQVKVEQIKRKADVLQGYADRFPPLSQDLHIVRQTAAEYLPRTIDAYLALPVTDDTFTSSTREAALLELRSQLTLLDSKLDEIAQDLQRQDMDRLLANRRFLEERFDSRAPDVPARVEQPQALGQS